MPQVGLDISIQVINKVGSGFKEVKDEAVQSINEMKDAQVSASQQTNQAISGTIAKTQELNIASSTAYDDLAKSSVGSISSLNNVKESVKSLGESNDLVYSQMAVAYRKINDPLEESTKKTKSLGEQLKETSKHAHELRRSMFVVTAALAVMIKGLSDAAEYDKEAKKTFDAFQISIKTLSATIGATFAPAIQGLTFMIDGFRIVIEAALTGFVKLFSFVFEYLSQLPSAFKNIFDNIKAVFTGDDPIGIAEGFKQSFDRALEVADIAAGQIAGKMENIRVNVGAGRTLTNESEQVKAEEKRKEDAIKKRADTESRLKLQAVEDTKSMLSAISEQNKAAGIVFQGINLVESIIATARAVTEALPNIPLAITVGAIGAAKTALIASQKFAVGTPEVPNDMYAQIHKGETIIPATFAEGIRRGELTLAGGNNSNTNSNIEVNVYYPRISKADEVKELAGLLGNEIEKQLQYARGI